MLITLIKNSNYDEFNCLKSSYLGGDIRMPYSKLSSPP